MTYTYPWGTFNKFSARIVHGVEHKTFYLSLWVPVSQADQLKLENVESFSLDLNLGLVNKYYTPTEFKKKNTGEMQVEPNFSISCTVPATLNDLHYTQDHA